MDANSEQFFRASPEMRMILCVLSIAADQTRNSNPQLSAFAQHIHDELIQALESDSQLAAFEHLRDSLETDPRFEDMEDLKEQVHLALLGMTPEQYTKRFNTPPF